MEIRAEGGAGPADIETVRASLERLPPALRNALANKDVRVVTCPERVTAYATWLAGDIPEGWECPQNDDSCVQKYWDDVPGAYLIDRREVIICTTRNENGARRVVPRGPNTHGAYDLALHETMHGYDYAHGELSGRVAAFVDAWTADRGALKNPYYTRDGTGRRETFAESATRYFGGDPVLSAAWPNLCAFWTAYSAGGEGAGAAAAPHAHRSIGYGARLPNGSIQLFLDAVSDTAHGHAAMRLEPGSAMAERMETLRSTALTESADQEYFLLGERF